MKSRVTGAGLICVALAVAVLLWPAMTSAANLNGFWEQNYGTYSIFGNDTTHTYYRWNGTGQGWSHSNISTGNWCYLGKFLDVGASSWYMPGDGAWHNIDAAWAYSYTGGAGSWWTPTVGFTVFAYSYGNTRWYNQGATGGWQTLGSGGMSAAFMGDGAWHNLSATWAYSYTGGAGTWWTPTAGFTLFAYSYGNTRWYNQGATGGWAPLGSAGMSAAFMGDGTWHNVSATWAYVYLGGTGCWWTPTVGSTVFAYNYGPARWYDAGKVGGWAPLGSGGMSAAFMGDGTWHNLSATWAYSYSGGVGSWWTPTVGISVFSYNYSTGQWGDQGKYGGWQTLGSAGTSASFMGDGAWHNLSATWAYSYSGGVGSWWTPSVGTSLFSYNYGNGQWSDHGKYGGSQKLGPTGFSAAFLGDGNWHTLDSIWSYEYVSGTGYLKGSVSTWYPSQYGGDWGESLTQFSCNYTNQVLGLYDSGNASSVVLYDYNGGSSYNCKWEDWNYDLGTRSETSAAIVFYTGSTTHDVSSWLNWLPVNPNPGYITRTETWDFTSPEYAIDGVYAHSVRAFWSNRWVVQNEQGSRGNCVLVAALDALEQVTGLYWDMGETMILARNRGYLDIDYGSMYYSDISALYADLGQGTVYVNAVSGRNLTALTTWANAGNPVIVAVDLANLPAFGDYLPGSGHALVFHGLDGGSNVEITNGWNARYNTTQIIGTNPVYPYPITLIDQNDFQTGYEADGGWSVFVRK